MGLWILLTLASLAGVFVMIAVPLRLLRGAPPWVRRTVAASAAALGVVLGISIPGEILLRRAGMKPYWRTFPGQYENSPKSVPWAHVDRELGWTAAPGFSDTNTLGFRDRRDFTALAPDPSKTRVMILGDSFVWGSEVDTDETIPVLLEAELGDGFECFNVGAPGWGIDQMVLAHDRFVDAIAPDVVILVFIDDDVLRVLEAFRRYERMNKPCFEIRDGALVPQDSPTAFEGLLNRVGRRSAFFGALLQCTYVLTAAKPVIRRLFADVAEKAVRRGGRLVVLRIPTGDDGTPAARIRRRFASCAEAARDAGALYLDPSAELHLVPGFPAGFYEQAGHLSPRGTRFVADFLRRHVFDQSGR